MKLAWIKTLIVVFIFAFFVNVRDSKLWAETLKSKGIKISASVDKRQIYLGQEIHLTVKLLGNNLNCMHLICPTDEDFSPFVVKEAGDCKSQPSGIEKQYVITVFRLGKQRIPALKFIYNRNTYKTEPIVIEVKELLPKDVSKIRMRDVEGMWVEPFPWKMAMFIVLGVIGLFSVIVWFITRKSYQEEEGLGVRAYWEIAKERIDALGKKNLIELGHLQSFYYELTEILRYFLQNKYKFPALEMTNTELLQYLKKLPISPEDKERIRDLIYRSGPIKYAKQELADNRLCYQDLEFVRGLIQSEFESRMQQDSNE